MQGGRVGQETHVPGGRRLRSPGRVPSRGCAEGRPSASGPSSAVIPFRLRPSPARGTGGPIARRRDDPGYGSTAPGRVNERKSTAGRASDRGRRGRAPSSRRDLRPLCRLARPLSLTPRKPRLFTCRPCEERVSLAPHAGIHGDELLEAIDRQYSRVGGKSSRHD